MALVPDAAQWGAGSSPVGSHEVAGLLTATSWDGSNSVVVYSFGTSPLGKVSMASFLRQRR